MMMTNENLVCAVLKCDNELTIFESDRPMPVANAAIETLLEDLTDDMAVLSADVLADAFGTVCDLKLNGLSVGYFATRAYCDAYNLEQAELIYHGEFNEYQLKKIVAEQEGRIVIVPLFLEEI